MSTEYFCCVRDFAKRAEEILPIACRAYFLHGADEEVTLHDNEEAFSRYLLLPRILKCVSDINLSTSVLGNKIDFPVCVAPSALHGLVHPDGETATARGAAALGTAFTLSTFSNTSIEEIGASCSNLVKFFQLYISVERSVTVAHVRRAERSGFKAIIVTVDVPVGTKLRLRKRYPCALLPHQKLANFDNQNAGSGSSSVNAGSNDSWEVMNQFADTVLTWDDIRWLVSITHLPVVVKGIMRADDAVKALECGVRAIYVSNHGGRSLDTIPATIDVLAHIVREIGGRCEIYVDGGFRTGTDVLKALALGARAVFVGRPALFGLACNGAEGVKQVLSLYRDELRTAMQLAGCSSLDDICAQIVTTKRHYSSQL